MIRLFAICVFTFLHISCFSQEKRLTFKEHSYLFQTPFAKQTNDFLSKDSFYIEKKIGASTLERKELTRKHFE